MGDGARAAGDGARTERELERSRRPPPGERERLRERWSLTESIFKKRERRSSIELYNWVEVRVD